MSTLKYTIVGKELVSVSFACHEDAILAADDLVNLPAVINITVDGISMHKKARYELSYTAETSEEGTYRKHEWFSFIEEAARYADRCSIDGNYWVTDLLTGEKYYLDDLECLSA